MDFVGRGVWEVVVRDGLPKFFLPPAIAAGPSLTIAVGHPGGLRSDRAYEGREAARLSASAALDRRTHAFLAPHGTKSIGWHR